MRTQINVDRLEKLKNRPRRRKLGKKGKKINLKMLTRLAAIGATQDEIALVMGISKRSLRIDTSDLKDGLPCTLSVRRREALEKGWAKLSVSLKRTQVRGALGKDATLSDPKARVPLLIWCGKNFAGQADRRESLVDISQYGTVQHEVRHKFDESRFAELYLLRTGRGVAGVGSASTNGN